MFSYTNGAHEIFCWVLCCEVFKFLGKDLTDSRVRSGKSLSLGMPQKASPLSSWFIGNFTWSYICIHRMICVLLGASIYFVMICLLLFRTMFCIFYSNKSGIDSLYYAYFASIHVAVWKTESLPLLQKLPRKVRERYNVESFCILSSDKFITVGILVRNFGVREVLILLHSLQTVLFWQIAVMFALFAYVRLFNDSILG